MTTAATGACSRCGRLLPIGELVNKFHGRVMCSPCAETIQAYELEEGETVEEATPADLGTSLPPPIRGWLILLSIGLVISPIDYVYRILMEVFRWHMVPVKLQLFTAVQLATYLFLASFTVGVAIPFFQKKREAPRLFITLLVVRLALAFGLAVWVSQIMEEVAFPNELPGLLLVAVIWVPYMLVSKRVKATFIVP